VAAGTTVDITFTSPLIAMGRYLVQLDDSGAGYEVTHEQFTSVDHEGGEHSFDVDGGGVHSTDPALPLPDRGRLYLPTAANLPAFLPAFDALRRMGFYNLSPEVIRAPQTRGIGTRLARDGGNLAGMLELLARAAPHQKKLVEEYLALIAPGTVAVESRPVLGSTLYSLAFQEAPTNAPAGWFYAQSISDGTLRALGVLVALFQYDDSAAGVSVVGIEEPEAALHARAVAVLRDALQEAAEHRQVLVTTHSPELLDDRDLDPEALLAVEAINGATVVGPPDPVGLNTMQEHLLTAGELVRANQLFPAAGRE
jgi:predicted ATPase